jgi:hypothetical protein
MPPLSSIIAEYQPQGVLEVGRDRHGVSWAAIPDLVEARVVDIPDREPWVAYPEALASELAGLDVPLQLVIDHAFAGPATASSFIEVLLGRLSPGGRYVVDGVLPADALLQLMLTTVRSPDVVEQVDLLPRTTVLTRGSRVEWSEPIRLDELTTDPFGIGA